jgi:hypothetical protein
MEGRLMLSAAPVELASPVWQGSLAIDVVGQINPGAGQYLRFNLSSEGGYILTDATTTTYSASDSIVRANNHHTVILPSDLNSRGDLFNGDLDGSVDLSGFGSNGGLQPVVIVNPMTEDTNAATSTPLVITPQENAVGSSEGGAISIHSVLASVRAEAAVGSQQARPTLASRDALAAPNAHTVATSSSRALSGEWGRAIVFEPAGGEPASGERPSASERGSQNRVGDVATHADGPFSMTNSRHDTGASSSRDQNAARRDGASDDGVSQGENVDTSRKQASVGERNERQFDTAQAALARNSTARELDASALATAAAFEEFGEDSAARVESSTGSPWWRSWALAPVLMALALERIAARRWRHPQKETLRSLVRIPLQRSQTRPDDRD